MITNQSRQFAKRLVIGVVALTVTVFIAPMSASAGVNPGVEFSWNAYRGQTVAVRLSDLTPNGTYSLATDAGTFSDSGTNITSIIAGSGGTASVELSGTEHASPELGALTIDGNALAHHSENFRAPNVSVSACSSASVPVETFGFADGSYTISSPALTFSESRYTATHGALSDLIARASDSLPPTYEIVTKLVGSTSQVTHTQTRQNAFLGAITSGPTPWAVTYRARCFNPHETVQAVAHGAFISGSSAVADSKGLVTLRVTSLPGPQIRRTGTVTFKGASSGQRVTADGVSPVAPTTLSAGHALATRPVGLASTKPGFQFVQRDCNLSIYAYNRDGSSYPVWTALQRRTRPATCTAALRPGGNLVLLSARGAVLWSTHTAATGSGARLIMHSNGVAVLYAKSGRALWSTGS